ALAGAALAVRLKGGTVDSCRVVFSGVAPIPWRAVAVEAAIQGRRLDRQTVTQAMDAAVKDAKPMEKNGYKVTLLRGIVEEELTVLA
ncbi:MAG: xanthine dehydrogenase family protein subunit M, partial [Deltaproteobacteria bacterium]|nr:xanthine dehydrogenase family protein subunit M [Deltaproteobacteria bacterium]